MKVPKKYYYYLAFIVLAAVYIVASLFEPLAPNRFRLTPARTHELQLTFLLPIVVIWAAAAFGAERFQNYTDRIKTDKDGATLSQISTGLVLLAAAIIISGLFGVLRGWALKDGWLSAYTIASNYISALLPLIAFAFIFAGSQKLRRLVKVPPQAGVGSIILTIGLVAVAIVYVVVLTRYQYANATPDPAKYSSYYMSDPLVLLSLALPYLAGWGLAIKAILNIHLYRRQVKGVIYKAALARLAIGLAVVISFYVLVQLLVAFSAYLATASLTSLLVLVYLLIIIYGIGFVLIALGANKLTDIEKVY